MSQFPTSSSGPSPSAGSPSPSQPTRPSRTRRSTAKAPEVEERPAKRQRLQEEKLRHKKLFETKVEVLHGAGGVGGKVYRCLDCSTVKTTRILITNHVANCGAPFKGKRRGKNKKCKHTCNLCDFQAGTVKELAKHRRDEHSDRWLPHRCTTCGQGYKYARSLKRHLLTHAPAPKLHHCSTCGEAFGRNDVLMRHKMIHEKDSPSARRSSQDPISGGGQGSKWDKFVNTVDPSSSSDDEDAWATGDAEANEASTLDFSEALRRYGRKEAWEFDLRRAQSLGFISDHQQVVW